MEDNIGVGHIESLAAFIPGCLAVMATVNPDEVEIRDLVDVPSIISTS